MAKKSRVKGVDKVVLALRRLGRESKKDSKGKYTVGYSAPYAIFVHERLDLRHQPGKQAKFLEQPLRTEQRRMAEIVRKTVRSGGTVDAGNALAALYLKKQSQLLCPISGWDPIISPLLDTSGTLHNSAFVKKDGPGAVSTIGPETSQTILRERKRLSKASSKRRKSKSRLRRKRASRAKGKRK